jgi:integrase
MRPRKIRVRKYKDSNRPNLKFYVNFREAGKRKRSFFETEAKAKSFAALKNAELRRFGIEGSEFSTAIRVMAQHAAELLQPFGKTITDAVTDYVARLRASERSCTAVQLVRELLKAKEADGHSRRHVGDVRSRLGKFAEKFGDKMVATITSAEIDDWLRSLNVAPVTRNHYRRLIILAFNFAVQRGYATDNPAVKTARAKVVGKPPGILSVDETARLLEAATPDILPYVAIGAFAGLRRAELERLDWSEIDFGSKLIEVTAQKSKTAQRRFVKLQPNLRAWLLPVRKRSGSIIPPENFRRSFDAVRRAAGITEWPDNALRHSFASYHMARFENANATALELGHHDSRITFAHYRELVRPSEAKRYWNIRPAPVSKVVQMPLGKRSRFQHIESVRKTARK